MLLRTVQQHLINQWLSDHCSYVIQYLTDVITNSSAALNYFQLAITVYLHVACIGYHGYLVSQVLSSVQEYGRCQAVDRNGSRTWAVDCALEEVQNVRSCDTCPDILWHYLQCRVTLPPCHVMHALMSCDTCDKCPSVTWFMQFSQFSSYFVFCITPAILVWVVLSIWSRIASNNVHLFIFVSKQHFWMQRKD